jgi:hypothetical protein
MPGTLNYCTHCGALVDGYAWSTVEPGNPAGDGTYYCRTCGLEWPAPNVWVSGPPCERCGEAVPPGQRYCASCGLETNDVTSIRGGRL